MIHDHPDNDRWTRSDLEQLRRFLISRDADTSAYRLAHEKDLSTGDGDAHAAIRAVYGGERFRNGNEGAVITWSTSSGDARVQTDMGEAQFTIAFAFDQPEHLALFTELPAETPAPAAASALGLEREVLADRVSTFDPGSYVAPDPDGAGWSLFLVEPYGEIVILADAQQPAPLLQMLAASRKRQAQDLAGRMAMFMVPVAAA
jgi:hypothetical protein